MSRLALLIGLVCASFSLILIATAAHAQQSTISDYETARDDFFYNEFYKTGGFTLYCGAWFAVENRGGQTHKSLGLNIEHI